MAAISDGIYHCLTGVLLRRSCCVSLVSFSITGFFLYCLHEVKLFREASERPSSKLRHDSLESVMEFLCQIRQRVLFPKRHWYLFILWSEVGLSRKLLREVLSEKDLWDPHESTGALPLGTSITHVRANSINLPDTQLSLFLLHVHQSHRFEN